jgi:transcriptional antiterminator
MVYIKKIIKQDLLKLFDEGKSEAEAFDEISKTHTSSSVSLKAIGNWFEKFSSGESNIDSKKSGRKLKYTDEFLINLVNENPNMNMSELAKLTNTSTSNISNRLRKINSGEQKVDYIAKGYKSGAKKFTDEFLINLIADNPGVNMAELGKLANTCESNISIRLKKINSNRSSDDKIVLDKNAYKSERKICKKINDEYLIKLVGENPELNIYELANLLGVSTYTVYFNLEKFNTNDQKVNYIKKSTKNGTKKFTNEFLVNLVNENPELNTYELAKLANVSQGTISRRLRQINSNKSEVSYIKKGMHNGPTKFTNEFLINLVNQNPQLNMRELAELAESNQSTISRRLKQINSSGEKAKYIKKK